MLAARDGDYVPEGWVPGWRNPDVHEENEAIASTPMTKQANYAISCADH